MEVRSRRRNNAAFLTCSHHYYSVFVALFRNGPGAVGIRFMRFYIIMCTFNRRERRHRVQLATWRVWSSLVEKCLSSMVRY
jgi:hypothetical protein